MVALSAGYVAVAGKQESALIQSQCDRLEGGVNKIAEASVQLDALNEQLAVQKALDEIMVKMKRTTVNPDGTMSQNTLFKDALSP